jgi:hypothetical protein
VDQAAEDIVAMDLLGGWRSRYALALWPLGRRQVEAAVGTVAVVVPGVEVQDAKEVAEVAAAGDQEMV